MTGLEGTWYIVRTSLPFWRNRSDAAISYMPLPDGTMADLVTYRRNGKSRLVAGIDRSLGDGKWAWRGVEPATFFLRSHWAVLAQEGNWAITRFDKTLFTSAGVDIYCRRRHPLQVDVAPWIAKIAEWPETAQFTPNLFSPLHQSA